MHHDLTKIWITRWACNSKERLFLNFKLMLLFQDKINKFASIPRARNSISDNIVAQGNLKPSKSTNIIVRSNFVCSLFPKLFITWKWLQNYIWLFCSKKMSYLLSPKCSCSKSHEKLILENHSQQQR